MLVSSIELNNLEQDIICLMMEDHFMATKVCELLAQHIQMRAELVAVCDGFLYELKTHEVLTTLVELEAEHTKRLTARIGQLYLMATDQTQDELEQALCQLKSTFGQNVRQLVK